jgi:5'-methylthioadenosine phosphorylase
MSDYADTPLTGADRVPIGVIGGSGLYDMEGVEIVDERTVETPFGEPSAPIRIGELEGRRIAFLPRHGEGHRFNPSSVPYRANIWAMKRLGVFWLATVSAVGSLREEVAPGDFVVPDQIIDKTFQRANTLYEEIAVHVGLSRPYDPFFRDKLLEVAREELDEEVHDGGTYVCMEGPAFSTIAESNMHRQWGADLIGMTAMPEARLAREAEMAYATLALPTDYDVWREETPKVAVDNVLEILDNSTDLAKKVLEALVPEIPLEAESETAASGALETAIVTSPEVIPESTRQEMSIVLGDYIGS